MMALLHWLRKLGIFPASFLVPYYSPCCIHQNRWHPLLFSQLRSSPLTRRGYQVGQVFPLHKSRLLQSSHPEAVLPCLYTWGLVVSPIVGFSVICIRKLLSMFSRNLLDYLMTCALLHCHSSRYWSEWSHPWGPGPANTRLPPVVWSFLWFLLIKPSVADMYNNIVNNVGLPANPDQPGHQPSLDGAPYIPAALSHNISHHA